MNKIVYIDGIDWENELGETDVTVWPSKNSLLKNTPCASSCGVVRCEVKMLEWVHPQNLSKEGNKQDPIALWEGHIKRYEQRIEKLRTTIERARNEKS